MKLAKRATSFALSLLLALMLVPSMAFASEVSNSTNETQSISLEGVNNARQLGGYITVDGRVVKDGLLLRTGRLIDGTSADLERLASVYNLRDIIDLRSDSEISSHPDPAIGSAASHLINPLPPALAPLSMGVSSDVDSMSVSTDSVYDPALVAEITSNFRNYYNYGGTALIGGLNDYYVRMSTEPGSFAAMREVFNILLEDEEGSVLFHCTHGKDRTGMLALLILVALGVDKDTAIEDYLLTNQYRADTIALWQEIASTEITAAALIDRIPDITDEKIQEKIPGYIELLPKTQGVDISYIETFISNLETRFGSIRGFLTSSDGIGLTELEIQALQDKYTQSPNDVNMQDPTTTGTGFWSSSSAGGLAATGDTTNFALLITLGVMALVVLIAGIWLYASKRQRVKE